METEIFSTIVATLSPDLGRVTSDLKSCLNGIKVERDIQFEYVESATQENVRVKATITDLNRLYSSLCEILNKESCVFAGQRKAGASHDMAVSCCLLRPRYSRFGRLVSAAPPRGGSEGEEEVP